MQNVENVKILYEDNHLLVVEKPPNMPAQADSSGDADLLGTLKAYIGEKYQKPGAVYLGLVHRLDRPVGGVMVFARTSKAAKRLCAQFQSGEARKRYAAIVDGMPDADGFYTDYLRDVENEARVQVHALPVDGAKSAMLRFHRIACQGSTALLDVELLTGRKHQIRAQLAAHGCPILYDQRYHPHPERGQIALWAYVLTLMHPTKMERMTFCSVPKGKAYDAFCTEVTALPAFVAGYALFANDALLVADKQAGVEVTTEDGGEQSLQAAMENCFSTLYPVHRIDANTRGLVLFARTPKAQATLLECFKCGEMEKTYHVAVRGTPVPAEDIVTAYACKDAERGLLCVRETAFPGATQIKTGYRVREVHEDCAFLEVRLYTGKTHQIRAHMAFLGHPVLGDDKYGDRAWNRQMHTQKQALIAHRLSFTFEGKRLAFTSSYELYKHPGGTQ